MRTGTNWNDELFRRFFRRAAGSGKLSELWSEVGEETPRRRTEEEPI